MVFNHIVADIRAVNHVHKDHKVNKSIQAFMYTMLADEDTTAAKRSLDVMITLYKKRVWVDAKTVNVIATACLSKVCVYVVRAVFVRLFLCVISFVLVRAFVFVRVWFREHVFAALQQTCSVCSAGMHVSVALPPSAEGEADRDSHPLLPEPGGRVSGA